MAADAPYEGGAGYCGAKAAERAVAGAGTAVDAGPESADTAATGAKET